MKYKLLLLPLLALPLMLSSTPTQASPPIRFRTPKQIQKSTDFLLRARIQSRNVQVVGKTRTTRIRVKVYRVGAQNKRARAHRALKRGTVLEFSRSCSLHKLGPKQQWRIGYPNARCGGGWTALPRALTRAKGTLVTLRLKLQGQGQKTWYSVVPTTFPTTVTAIARIK